MDVYSSYLPDVLSYASLRHSSYTNKQQNAWSMEAPKEKRSRDASEKKGRKSCEDCPICQERQRRPLATYIRSKSRQDRCASTSISEDCEEDAEEDAEEDQEKEKTNSAVGLLQQRAKEATQKIPAKK